MSTENERIDRALKDSDRPFDATAEEALEPDPHPDRTLKFERTSFSRMRMSWIGDDAIMLGELEAAADRLIKQHFKMALDVMEQLFKCVRTPLTDGEGEVQTGQDGRPLWVTDEYSNPEEDWNALGDRERRRFLYTITTHMHEWERARTRIWTQAMYAKAQFEEAFAKGFKTLPSGQLSGKPTIEDKTQHGYRHSMEERYFAIFRTGISKEADGIIRSMRGLEDLLKETLND